jgi:thiamine biosynthesis lipoprotein
MNIVRRARPWLGTIVAMRVEGLREADALRAIQAAFDEVAAVHRLMSFHEAGSDLSRLHRQCDTQVDARTYEVIAAALGIAESSQGSFDPTIAANQVRRGSLPRIAEQMPDNDTDWRDIELLGARRIRLRRPLWIDLGGIAKGYAVDRATDILFAAGATQACVNAGGDLRLRGDRAECIELRGNNGSTSAVEIADAAVATSTVSAGSHVHGITREPMHGARTVSVIAPTCMIADALTKVVLADPATPLLATFSAQACLHDPQTGWRTPDLAA